MEIRGVGRLPDVGGASILDETFLLRAGRPGKEAAERAEPHHGTCIQDNDICIMLPNL